MNYRIKVNSFIARLAARKLGSADVAIVIGNTIHLHNATREQLLANPRWLKHELVHVKQFKQYGFLPFIIKYLWESIRNGYANNRYEIEARAGESV